MGVTIAKHIFREYDIRGTVDKDLTNDFAYILGRAYGRFAKAKGSKLVAVGYDCRLNSPDYARHLSEGIAREGLKVLDTGMGPTPQLYFAVFHKNTDGGIQVTGSHNPKDMNGFKIMVGKSTLSGAEIQELRGICESVAKDAGALQRDEGSKKLISQLHIKAEYIDYLIDNSKSFMGKRKLRVVVDAGNGTGGMIGPAVLRGLGVQVEELFCDPDGNFPNHHPDPAEPHNLGQLVAKVKSTKADFGIAWDGDADRIGVVDEKGEILYGDLLLILYARQVLAQQPGATIIGDVKCTARLFADVKKHGGNPVMWKTGHSLVKAKLKETGGALAGEVSGHIFFKHRFFGFDDAIYAASRLVEIVSNASGPFSNLLKDLPPAITTPEIRVDCPEEVKFKVASEAKNLFKEFEVSTIDGARISFPKGWGLVRASNTQSVLVMRFEAETPELVKEYQTLVEKRVNDLRAKIQGGS